MQIVLLQAKLADHDIQRLTEEFPRFLFLSFNERTYKELSKDDWEKVEIVYGSRLTEEELARAPELRWIHSPTPNLKALCVDAIKKSGKIILTTSLEENTIQIGEYVMAGILTFAKNLLNWKQLNADPDHVWNSKCRDTMWQIKDKIFLQIGLGQVGNEIVRYAKMMEMKVWSIHEKRTFHPYSDKVLSWDDLESVLPQADIISVALPRRMQNRRILTARAFELIKSDIILTILGGLEVFDDKALVKAADSGKFRGILWDAFYQKPLPPSSELWRLKNIIITPEASPRPKSGKEESLHLFRYNLRQYLHDNYTDMRNVVRFVTY